MINEVDFAKIETMVDEFQDLIYNFLNKWSPKYDNNITFHSISTSMIPEVAFAWFLHLVSNLYKDGVITEDEFEKMIELTRSPYNLLHDNYKELNTMAAEDFINFIKNLSVEKRLKLKTGIPND